MRRPRGRAGERRRSREILVKAAGEGDRILLTVSDGGPGIPEADRSRAIERFVRLEQSRSQPGSGLGLSLAAAVARLHGGELDAGRQPARPQDRHRIAARRTGTECGTTLPGTRSGPECFNPGRLPSLERLVTGAARLTAPEQA